MATGVSADGAATRAAPVVVRDPRDVVAALRVARRAPGREAERPVDVVFVPVGDAPAVVVAAAAGAVRAPG